MVWTIPRTRVRTSQKPLLPGSLEELCGLIKKRVEKQGKAWGTIVTPFSGFYNREYHFAGTFYRESVAVSEREELVKGGVKNLRFCLPGYDVVQEGSENPSRPFAPERVKITKKSDYYREAQI